MEWGLIWLFRQIANSCPFSQYPSFNSLLKSICWSRIFKFTPCRVSHWSRARFSALTFMKCFMSEASLIKDLPLAKPAPGVLFYLTFLAHHWKIISSLQPCGPTVMKLGFISFSLLLSLLWGMTGHMLNYLQRRSWKGKKKTTTNKTTRGLLPAGMWWEGGGDAVRLETNRIPTWRLWGDAVKNPPPVVPESLMVAVAGLSTWSASVVGL